MNHHFAVRECEPQRQTCVKITKLERDRTGLETEAI